MTKHLDVDKAQKLIQPQICTSLSPYVNKTKNKHLKIVILKVPTGKHNIAKVKHVE